MLTSLRTLRVLLGGVLALAAFTLQSFAQSAAATGTITGRVFNPATQEYVRNAELAVTGTNLVAYSGDDGSYTITGVPAGEVTLQVTFTGYESTAARLGVAAGQTATRDFELKGATYRPAATPAKEEAIVLGQFVVSSEREGNAKAIMDQRAAINIKQVVSADNFGDITGGNIGEFIKYLPGVVMDYNNSDARSARIGGLDPRYVGVTVDGMTMASAASNSSRRRSTAPRRSRSTRRPPRAWMRTRRPAGSTSAAKTRSTARAASSPLRLLSPATPTR